MNLNVLRYVIEVEKNRSITKAARQLFISQPNLSRDIRELEEEIGFSIFTRSSRGVVPTDKGREFLLLARKAVKQYQALEHYCSREEKDSIALQVCVPRASYISAAFTSFLAKYAKGRTLDVSYQETDALYAIQSVEAHSCSLAIIRCADRYEKALLPLLRRKELVWEILCKYELAVVMSERHPLSGTSVLTADMLATATEIICEETSLPSYLHEPPETEHNDSCIRIQERGSQFDLLAHVPGTYMFTPPIPDSILATRHLVQKKYHGSPRRMTDLLIYPEDYRPTRTENAFLDTVREFAPEG